MPPLSHKAPFAILLALFSWLNPLNAADLYVSTTGNDSTGTGTLAAPYATIQKAATVAIAGDTVYIRAGVYRETITPVNSGTAGSRITYRNYPGETVTVSGADLISSGSWTLDSGNVYKTPLAASYFTSAFNQSLQVFVDGEMVTLAKWPNTTTRANAYPTGVIPPVDISHPAKSTTTSFVFKTRDTNANLTTGVVVDTALPAKPSGFYDGAQIFFQPNNGAWSWTFSGLVNSVPASGNQITFTSRSDSGEDFNQSVYNAASRYYLFNKKEFLDSPGEWWHDTANGQLYLWTPTSAAPSTRTIEVKKRDFAFNLTNRSYITIQGLTIVAASITTDSGSGGDAIGFNPDGSTNYPWRGAGYLAPSTGITLDGITARYLNHFTDVSGHFFLQWGTASGIVLSGTGHTVRNSLIERTAGNGVLLQGEGSKAFNNTFNDISYAGVDTSAISTLTAVGGSYPNGRSLDHEISYNTVRRSGRSGIYPLTLGNSAAASGQFKARVHHNDVTNFGLQDWDVGGIHVPACDLRFTRIDHNLVSEGVGFTSVGIYLDYVKNAIIDHNVVWNIEWGIKLQGQFSGVNNTLVYNNTASVINTSATPYGPFGIGSSVGTNVGTVLRNNILSVITPPSANGYSAITTANFTSAETVNNLLWNGVANSSTDPKFVARATALDATNVNYQLQAGSAAIDTGDVIGTYTRDGVSIPPFSDAVSGSAPDHGAYEYGVPAWSAGANYSQNFPPEFSPAPGNYNSSVTLTLTSPTAGSVIRYTTDGSTPTASSGILYTAPFTLATSATVRAIATGSGQTDSTVTIGSYDILRLAALGNGTAIILHDASPDLANHTDFGTAEIGFNTVTRVFTLTNLSAGSLSLTGATPVTVTGSSAFTVITQPALTLAAGASTTFALRFTPSSAGAQTATVNITQASLPNGTYDFAIGGTAISAQPDHQLAPEALVVSRPTGTTSTAPLVLRNTGRAPLTWSLSLPSAPWLTGASPASGTLAAGASQTIAIGLNTAGISNGSSFAANLTLGTNELATPTTTIPVSLLVSNLPTAPAGLRLTVNSSTEIGLAWSDLANNETAYLVERSTNGTTGWAQISQLAADTTAYLDTGLPSGAIRYYRVRARNASGDSAYSDIVTNDFLTNPDFLFAQPFADTNGTAPSALTAVPGITSASGVGSVQTTAALSYPQVDSSGNGFTTGNGRTFLNLDTTLPALAPYVSGGFIGGTGTGVLYVSWLARGITAQEANTLEFRTGNTNDTEVAVAIGTTFGIDYLRLMTANTLNGSTANYYTSTTTPAAGTDLYVAKFTFAAGSATRIDVYLNQATEGTPTYTGTGFGQFNTLAFSKYGSALPAFDEIRFAKTYAAAVPSPPTAAADPAPTLGEIAPTSGSHDGGTTVTLTGTDFNGVSQVSFGGVPATNIVIVSPTQLTCVTPAHAAGTYHVAVTTLGGTATLADAFTFSATPPPTGVETFRTAYGLAANGSQDLLTPAGDGVANLLKYAFNMLGIGPGQETTLATPNTATLAADGSAGLPYAGLGTGGDAGKLQITYIRRKSSASPAPGITYAVEFSNDIGLTDPWATNGSATESTNSIDTTFERVTITDDTATPTKRFVRVKITAP